MMGVGVILRLFLNSCYPDDTIYTKEWDTMDKTIDVDTLKLQEMVEFLQGINYEIAEIDSLVSPKCDIITVTSEGAQRLYTPERYGWIVDP